MLRKSLSAEHKATASAPITRPRTSGTHHWPHGSTGCPQRRSRPSRGSAIRGRCPKPAYHCPALWFSKGLARNKNKTQDKSVARAKSPNKQAMHKLHKDYAKRLTCGQRAAPLSAISMTERPPPS